MALVRRRTHDQGNLLTEQKAHIEDARDDIAELKGEMNERFDKVDKRFTDLGAQFWRIAGFIVGAMGVAVAIVSVVVR